MDFSLFFFGSYNQMGSDTYQLLLDTVKIADENGFKAVWTPERHFHDFGGVFPNPSVISAALAMITQNLQLRAGSIVSPLHHPVRIVEEWSVVDNLSNGRVGVSFTAGWHPDDFILNPSTFGNRSEYMYEQIKIIRQLWRGETSEFPNGVGNLAKAKTYPKPKAKELPIWITTTGKEESFIRAGRIGANVLTHLLYQDISSLHGKIKLYRQTLQENGYNPEQGVVTVMIHTFIGDDLDHVKQTIRQPFTDYLASSINLGDALRKNMNQSGTKGNDPALMKTMLQIIFERYWKSAALFGTPDSCIQTVRLMHEAGVNEIACLVDFGIEASAVMQGLDKLIELKQLIAQMNQTGGNSPLVHG
ncbi:LLM class flavin-dependent oxidoreductase [Brevibacillus antibioticus]|uniref:LLM class flavin-dependent oxidoreductase n=1 Tax=Brevibacillus antibioticus TaxID=2570228 RepID=A0A4U2YEB6_9BACL|nr:LLM class flavin-dependent oxidoreductase [Brevibacillus antibioticus]